ncbi:DUF4037 domain-containing protein [Streptomyces sp. NBC_00525]|uniref:DUF4037 domain-containing protein n=1 Tax=Streptomyces sp. NBC_00525 TaxID=2903660 RepID=UPI002E81E845|nr:DUF4037 domain-containing protein [Streptomyces sp. NBC_00525]WUC95202.1 DUF4037 domain-containing protein [Streptomyces sp. NBC_00525]
MTGLQLCHRFYDRAVAPLLTGVAHAAGLLGDGSEVLGFDDAVSPDHDFGPRAQVFVAAAADAEHVHRALERLPSRFEDFPVAFARGTLHGGAAHHQVEVVTAPRFFTDLMGRDPADGMTVTDWLTTPTQRLATLTGGAVFHDPEGALATRRTALEWYPDDVWRYVLAAAWLRVSQEEAFVGRTGSVGDDLGSALVTARVARDLVRLAFLVERRWAPYSKWLGSAFARLPLAGRVGPHLTAAVRATAWREREAALCAAQRELAVATNRLGLADAVDPEPRRFHTRDLRVLFGDRFTAALADRVTDPGVRALVVRLGNGRPTLPGAIDQAVDSVEILTRPDRCRAAAGLLCPDAGDGSGDGAGDGAGGYSPGSST